MTKTVYDFPELNLDDIKALQNYRNRTTYGVIGEVSAKPIDTNTFFNSIPIVVESIAESIKIFNGVHSPLSYVGRRFDELRENLPILYESYNKEVPTSLR